MDLTPRTKKIIAVVAGLTLITFLWAIHHVLLPFLVAFLLVYLLNPVVDWLAGVRASGFRLGNREINLALGRKGAVAIVFVAFFGLMTLGSLFVVPQLYAEGAKQRRMMSVSVHDRIGGTPGVTWAMDQFIAHAKKKSGVVFMRKDEIAKLIQNDPKTPKDESEAAYNAE